jgi:hypothetical protein
VRRLRRALLLLCRGAFVVIVVLALVAHARLYHRPDSREVRAQLAFVRAALDRGEARGMQQLFPEGHLFSYVLYGLAWVEQGMAVPAGDPLRAQAAGQARWALDQALTDEARRPFNEELDPPFGVFYAGWTNWLRAGVLLLAPPDQRDPALAAAFGHACDQIGAAFTRAHTPFLPAYPGAAWPVDSAVAVASLRMHDRLGSPRFSAVIQRWREGTRARLDPASGLIPHRVDPTDGRALEGARGTSQAVLARMLAEIDPAWAAAQYAAFRRRLVTTRLGLPGVREFPAGVEGGGDVDSGPLVLGVSMSATVVMAGAARVHGDGELAAALAGTMEFFGLAFTWGGQKRYALGLLPVGDAFIAWSLGARRWSDDEPPAGHPRLLPLLWRLPIHLLTLALLAPLGWLLFRRRRSPA